MKPNEHLQTVVRRAHVLLAAVAVLACGCSGRTSGRGPQADQKPEPPPPHLAKAIEECRAGNHGAACPALYEYVSAHPNASHRALAQYWLGYGEFKRQHYSAAAEAFGCVPINTQDLALKGKALLGRGDALFQLGRFRDAAGCYGWVDRSCQEVKSIAADEVLFKLGMCYKVRNMTETADWFFNKVIQLYSHGEYAAEARRMHSYFGQDPQKPKFYEIEAGVYEDKARAEAKAGEIKGLKVADVHVVELDTGLGEMRYAVRFGKFDTYNQARLRADQFRETSQLAVSVTPFDATQEIFDLSSLLKR